LPTVLIESLILNTPVVSTNCPSGPNEILVDKFSNYLAKVGDENNLKEKIEFALKYYPAIEEKYYKKFDYLNISKKYLELV
jgi:glycosyltransferase involved in cell wall biosynthesis